MINPAEIADNLVALLRDIDALVAAMGGDGSKIFAYHDRYPDRNSLSLAKYKLTSPGIMVAWEGTEMTSAGGGYQWLHRFSICQRMLESDAESMSNPAAGYYQLMQLIWKGVPNSTGQPLSRYPVHIACNLMDVQSNLRHTDEESTDLFEMLVSFTEIGDE